jgi:NTP pyrophosphatase (non-canonical NTP hydrolase)
MFQTKQLQPSTTNSTRIKTNMSLSQLVETNKTHNPKQKFNNNNNNNTKNKFNNNNNNNKNKFNTKNNMFYNKPKVVKPEFKISLEDFPVLLETTQTLNQPQPQTKPQSQIQNYSEKLKATKIEQENYKQRISKTQKAYKKKDTQDIISEYYNPGLSLRILNDRQEFREELNDMLGDISPYWNKLSEDELSLLDEEELLNSDNDDEYNNSIIEDW